MTDRIVLGWHLDSPKRLVEIAPDSIDQHTAVLAQSGGGKSFFLGRLIEEYLLQTKVRVVVLDVNGDFRKSHTVSDEPWKKPHLGEHEPWRRLPVGERRAGVRTFGERWASIPQRHVTLDNAWEPASQRGRLSIKWCGFKDPRPNAPRGKRTGLTDRERVIPAGLDPRIDGSACMAFWHACKTAAKRTQGFYTPAEHQKAVQSLRDSAAVDRSVADQVIGGLSAVAGMPIWAKTEADDDLAVLLWKDAREWRLLKIDLMSVRGREARLVVASHALWAVRDETRRLWEEALRSGGSRVPVFVVIDEAHNLVPENPEDAATERVASQVMRIASEGRKFGLHLILATQRPAKLRRGLLAECENVCVLRLQSPVDHDAAADTWGVSSKEIGRARHFGTGDGLLMGRWVPATTAIHAAWRRTAECGGRLDPEYWAKPY